MTFLRAATGCLLAVLVSTGLAKADSENGNVLARSNGVFSSNLYSAVSKGNENILICSLSLNFALTLLSLGADDNSLKELKTTLNHPDDKTAIISSYKKFSENIKYGKGLTIATKIFVDKKFELKQQFRNDLKHFDAGVDNVDFAGQPEESRVIINKFVDNKTNHLIPELFGDGAVSQDTVSLVVNAVYFKSKWKYPFLDRATEKTKFFGLDQEHEVEMMFHPEEFFDYFDDVELNAELLELPYTGGYSFLIILPKDKKGITEVENKIKARASNANSSPFTDIFNNTQKEGVEVYLPKFKFEQTHKLRQTLEHMGVKDIFGANANFTKLSDSPVAITDVIQKTYIVVNEKHTEAAAATGANIQPLSAYYTITKPIKFNADHPFIYIIKDKSTETPLFIGRYIKP